MNIYAVFKSRKSSEGSLLFSVSDSQARGISYTWILKNPKHKIKTVIGESPVFRIDSRTIKENAYEGQFLGCQQTTSKGEIIPPQQWIPLFSNLNELIRHHVVFEDIAYLDAAGNYCSFNY